MTSSEISHPEYLEALFRHINENIPVSKDLFIFYFGGIAYAAFAQAPGDHASPPFRANWEDLILPDVVQKSALPTLLPDLLKDSGITIPPDQLDNLPLLFNEGLKIGILRQSDWLVRFDDLELQTYLAYQFCQRLGLGTVLNKKDIGYKNFKPVWFLWLQLDSRLIPQIAEFALNNQKGPQVVICLHILTALATTSPEAVTLELIALLTNKKFDNGLRSRICREFLPVLSPALSEQTVRQLYRVLFDRLLDKSEYNWVRNEAARYLGREFPVSLSILTGYITGPDLVQVEAAYYGLSQAKNAEYQKYLIDAIAHQDKTVRRTIVSLLNRIPQIYDRESFRTRLEKTIQDTDDQVRIESLQLVSRFFPDEIFTFNNGSILASNDSTNRYFLLEYLVKHPVSDHLPYIRAALYDKDWAVRSLAAFLLAEFGDTQSIPDIWIILNNLFQPGHELTDSCLDALIKLGDPQILNRLLEIYRDKSIPLSDGYLESAITKFRPPEGLNILKEIFEKNTGRGWWTVRAIVALAPQESFDYLVSHTNGKLKRYAITGLDELKDERALDLIIEATRDPDRAVRLTAVRALKNFPFAKVKTALEWVRDNDAEKCGYSDYPARYYAADLLRKYQQQNDSTREN